MKKFFISSTFYDMHAERDMIQNIVQPAVNQKLNEQGEYVSFSDLRWGIDTISDTTKHSILDACFDEIDSCKPYFIVFIGGRYGWIPNELVTPYQDRFGNIEILNKSITELEVLYALKLNTNKLNRCLFYFKDDADYEDEDGLKREQVIERIGDLRQKIEKIAPTQIRHYNSIVDPQTEGKLAEQLVSDIYNIISSEKALSRQERIANQMKVKFDTSLPGLTSQWLDGLKNESIDLAVLLYPECKVKESLIINFTSQIKNYKRRNFINRLFGRGDNETNLIYINVGATKEISETCELQRYLIFQICDICKFDTPQMEDLSDVRLRILMSNFLTHVANAGKELYIIISEYDKLIDAHNTKWLPDIIKNITWIISLSNQSIAENLPSSTHYKSIYGSSHLGIIPFEEQITAYEKWSTKTVTPQVKNAIKLLPYANDYMTMEVIFNRLMHIDGKDIPGGDTKKIPDYMDQYIKNAPNNNNEAIRYFLRGDYHKFDADLCEFIFICMAFLNRGLTISDIERLAQNVGLSWTELDIIRFLNYESFLLTQYEDGRYSISSSALSNSLAKLYHQKFKFEYSSTIYDYLHEISETTPIKIDNFWFLCYQTNHFKEYLDYLNSLYQIRIDNTNLKAAFLPLFSNAEAIKWLLNSFKIEKLQYSSTDFIAELVSIVASTFSDYSPKLTEEFISATQNIKDISGDLTTEFRQHYTFALDKMKQHDYNGFVEHFNMCIELSNKQFIVNPPRIKYLDEDVDHKYPIASLQDMLEDQYGFSFVEEVAALMSKYADLPKEYRDEAKALNYAEKAKDIRNKLSKVTYILPEDINQLREGQDCTTVSRQTPSLLRGKAVELSKQSDREENVETKANLLNESIVILNKILAIPENDLVGRFKDSPKTIEYESVIYNECHRDIALSYERLSDIQDGIDKFMSLDNAYHHIIKFAQEHNNEQVLNDILRITRSIIPMASQYADESKCLKFSISSYLSFAETTPIANTMSFEERMFAEISENLILKEIKRLTAHNEELRSHWIRVCNNHINTFQSVGNIDAKIWMVHGLCRSFTYYVHELGLQVYLSEHIALMGSMLQKFEDYLHIGTINMIHENAKKCLDYNLTDEDLLSVLHIEKMYSQYMLLKGEFDKSLEASQIIIDYCRKNKHLDNEDFLEVEYQALKLNSGIYLENNDIGSVWVSVDRIADYAEKKYGQEQNLGNLTELANAKLNQVILWDKMSAEPNQDLWTIEHHNSSDAQKQLYDTYMLCYDFEDKDEQLSKLMRRIRQSHEIIREKGLGCLATPKTLDLVKHFKGMVNDAVQLEKEGKHDECVKQFTLLAKALQETHFVDIYFEADWYAGILFTLGQDAWANGLKDQTEKYYEEAAQIRYELDAEGISQNKENFALLLYFYALVILSKQLSQDTISQVIDLFNKSQCIFEEIENQLGPNSLSYYSSCCFNLGQIICLYTSAGNTLGLPFVESAINIMERLVNNYGLTKYQKDMEQFRRQYIALKNRR